MSTLSYLVSFLVEDVADALVTDCLVRKVNLCHRSSDCNLNKAWIFNTPDSIDVDVFAEVTSVNEAVEMVFGKNSETEEKYLMVGVRNASKFLRSIPKNHYVSIEVVLPRDDNQFNEVNLVLKEHETIDWENLSPVPEKLAPAVPEYALEHTVAENIGLDKSKDIDEAGKALALVKQLTGLTDVILPGHDTLDERLSVLILVNMIQDEVHGIYSGTYRGPSIELKDLETDLENRTRIEVLADKIFHGVK